MATGTAEDEEAGKYGAGKYEAGRDGAAGDEAAGEPDTPRQYGSCGTYPSEGAATGTGGSPEATEAGVLRWAFRCRRRWILLATGFTAVHQMCEAAVPVMIGAVVDHAIRPGSTSGLLLWLALLAALFALLSAAMRLGGRCNRNGSQGAAHELRLIAAGRILDPRGFTHSTSDPGSLLSTATADTLRIGLGNRAWVLGGGAVASLAFGAVTLLLTSVPLGLLVLIGLVPLLWATRLLSGPLSARSSAEQKHAARATGTAADLIRGIRVVKGLGAEDAAESRYRTASRTMLAATVRAARWNAGHQAVTLLLNGIFLAVVAWSGARLTVQGDISVGEFVASVGLAQFLVGPSTRFGAAMELRARARGSARRLAALLAEPYAVPEPVPAPRGDAPAPRQDREGEDVRSRGELLVEGLAHGPLREFTLRVPAGLTLGIAASDPADAAALLDVLALRAPPDAGRIELDGRSLELLGLDEARGTLLVADHDADLFDTTVEENVAVAASAPAHVPAAIDAADVGQVLAVLPAGRQSTVGERGGALSGGQRQRVALARALAADPAVLVLHEPTTAVDAVTEAKIAQGLRGLREDRTTVLVTTSPILLQSCDEVHFLEGGTVRASGTHGQLSAQQPGYRAVVTA